MKPQILQLFENLKTDIVIVAITIGGFFLFVSFLSPVRVGDGSEYYALSIAWSDTHKPYMSDASWVGYKQLYESSDILGLVSPKRMKNTFSSLSNGLSMDFNHFWFYSFLSAIITKIGDFFGIQIHVHTGFLLLHCLLLTTLLLIAYRNYGWMGFVAVLILTISSPILWYTDKVHTEFFTYCLTTTAVILFLRKYYFSSSLFLAIAGTQNISFAAISGFIILFGIKGRKKYSLAEVIQISITFFLLILSPSYYFFRWGVLQPLFRTGGAVFAMNLKYLFIWFLDFDIGLFPNWPFGIFLLVFATIVIIKRKVNSNSIAFWLMFVFIYISINLVANSSTTNINSGGTPSVARYSLWYLALFFPAILILIKNISSSKWSITTSALLLVCGVVYNYRYFNPEVIENYLKPTDLSYWVQTKFPGIYNPPPEIFKERYGGTNENASLGNNAAVIGPECRKILLLGDFPIKEKEIYGGMDCIVDYSSTAKLINHNLETNIWSNVEIPRYILLNNLEQKNIMFQPLTDKWYGFGNDGIFSFSQEQPGWGAREDEGVWTVGRHATLHLPCPRNNQLSYEQFAIEFEVIPYIGGNHNHVNLCLEINDEQIWSGLLEEPAIIGGKIPLTTCTSKDVMIVEFWINNPISPYSLGLSEDLRKLGIYLKSFRFTETTSPENRTSQ